MSVEPLVVSALVEEGTPKAAFVAGINRHDFQIYEEEFEWLEDRFEKRKPITRRIFCERFPDFEFVRPKEGTEELLEELKTERAYSSVASLIESVSETLLPENAVDTAEHMREILGEVVKLYSSHSDISLKSNKDHFEQVKQRRMLAKAGQTVGMPFSIPSLDFYFDGLCPGRLIGVLGRPGMGKSYIEAWLAWVAMKTDHRIALFSPEMNETEHTCRVHTLASYDPEVQKACGITQSFHNRDLMRGTGFDIKAYKRFCEYMESMPGECRIFTKKYRKDRLTAQYIGARIEDLGLHGVLIDPISKIFTGIKRNDNAVWDSYEKVHALQEVVEEHNVFAVATNWTTRQQGRSKTEKAPDLDESFGSDALAQESDHVIGLLYDEDDFTLTLRCSKSRFGKGRFTSVIDFHPNIGKFEEVNMSQEVASHNIATRNGHSTRGWRLRRPVKAKKVMA